MNKFIGKIIDKELNDFGIMEILNEETMELKCIDEEAYSKLQPFKKVVKERSDGKGYATYFIEQDLSEEYDIAFDTATNSVFAVREDLDINELYIPEKVFINGIEYPVENFEIRQSYYIEKIVFPKSINITFDTVPDLYDLYDRYLCKLNSLNSIEVFIDGDLTEVFIKELVDESSIGNSDYEEYIRYNMYSPD